MSKIKLNLLFGVSVIVARLVTNCYCEKLFLSFCFFSEFSLFWCNKVIFLYWCSVLSIIFVRCSAPRTELLWGSNSQCDFCGDVILPWLCSQDVIVGMYMVFLYILVFALYVQNRKSFCHCRTQLRRCKSFKPYWFVAYVKKNVFLLQASQRHDQDSWCRIFVTQHFEIVISIGIEFTLLISF
jgi:hypothetical protein